MAGGKETPRQKMIGMMYLVLTALLALNVAKDILDAFAVIDEGIVETNLSFTSKIDEQYAAFKAANEENPAKTREFYNQAEKLKKQADEAVEYITKLKGILYLNSSRGGTPNEQISKLGDDPELSNFIAPNEKGRDTVLSVKHYPTKEDYDTPLNLLFGDDHANPRDGDWSGKELQAKLENFKQDVLKSINEIKGLSESSKKAQIASIETIFNFEPVEDHEGQMQDWAFHLFDHVPIAGVQAIMSKVQSDVKAVEADILSLLFSRIDAADFKVSGIQPIVSTGKTLLAPGDSFKAEVILAAYDKTKVPEIYISQKTNSDGELVDSQKLDIVEGKGQVGFRVGANGSFDWKGVLKMPDPLTGELKSYPFDFAYKVSNAEAVIDPSALNVLYNGLENPIAVSVPGADSESITISVSGGTCDVKKSKPGEFLVKPKGTFKKDATVTVNVTAKNANGRSVNKGSKVFKIKEVPLPYPVFLEDDGTTGKMSATTLSKGRFLDVTLGEDFLFDGVKYDVVGYNLSIAKGGAPNNYVAQGKSIPGNALPVLSTVRKGDQVIFSNIKVKAPSGKISVTKGSLVFEAF